MPGLPAALAVLAAFPLRGVPVLPLGLTALFGPDRLLRAGRPGVAAVHAQPAFQFGDPQLKPAFPVQRRRQLRPQHRDLGVLRLHHSPQPGQQLTLLPGRQIGRIGHKPQACSTSTATSSTRYSVSRNTLTPRPADAPLNGHAQATEEFRPDAEEAKQMTRGRLALVDGTLWPCWSWERAPEMWAGKYKTTGHGSLIIGDEFGNIIFVSDPAPGCDHDMKKREGEVKEILDLAGSVIADKGFQGSGYVTPAKKPQHRELYTREHEYNNQVSSIRAPIERAVAHLKTWKILFTDYRRPLNTFLDSFRAAIGLYFFELSFQ